MNLTVFSAGANVRLSPGVEITGSHRIALEDDVFIGRDAQVMIARDRPEPGAMIVFGRGTSINRRALIAAVNEIVFGQYVLTAPGIYVADASHEYREVGIPVTMQGLQESTGRLEVGSHSWIGMNAALIGNIRIGIGSVIGSNAVVNRSIPDYCVAVGQPARVIRAYDSRTRDWVRVESEEHLQEVVTNGRAEMSRPQQHVPKIPIYAGPTVTIG
ncbi:MAG TPA: acyltransferase [Candidatus Dormibacteraeota bacterium]|nr:acyltransferase [Candidatus Dormibacteraeota bacterium]